MPRMTAKARQPAHFDVEYFSSVYKRRVTWKTKVTERGITARRDTDGTTVSIPWEKVISLALFYGANSHRDGTVAL